MLHPTLFLNEQRCSVFPTCISAPGGTAECHGWALAVRLLILVFDRGAVLIPGVLERKSNGKGIEVRLGKALVQGGEHFSFPGPWKTSFIQHSFLFH